MRTAALLAALTALLPACGGDEPGAGVPVPDREGALKSTPAERASRRAYDGAPPVVPHGEMGVACTECHDETGLAVAGLGFAPPMPHGRTLGLSEESRCRQCHASRATDDVFRPSTFAGLAQDLRPGARGHDEAPPVLPHPVFLRENCAACHSGPAAREEIRTAHPERSNCRQCHAEATVATAFARSG